MTEADSAASKKRIGECFRTEDGENTVHLGTEAEEIPGVEGGGGAEEELPSEEEILESCLAL